MIGSFMYNPMVAPQQQVPMYTQVPMQGMMAAPTQQSQTQQIQQQQQQIQQQQLQILRLQQQQQQFQQLQQVPVGVQAGQVGLVMGPGTPSMVFQQQPGTPVQSSVVTVATTPPPQAQAHRINRSPAVSPLMTVHAQSNSCASSPVLGMRTPTCSSCTPTQSATSDRTCRKQLADGKDAYITSLLNDQSIKDFLANLGKDRSGEDIECIERFVGKEIVFLHGNLSPEQCYQIRAKPRVFRKEIRHSCVLILSIKGKATLSLEEGIEIVMMSPLRNSLEDIDVIAVNPKKFHNPVREAKESIVHVYVQFTSEKLAAAHINSVDAMIYKSYYVHSPQVDEHQVFYPNDNYRHEDHVWPNPQCSSRAHTTLDAPTFSLDPTADDQSPPQLEEVAPNGQSWLFSGIADAVKETNIIEEEDVDVEKEASPVEELQWGANGWVLAQKEAAEEGGARVCVQPDVRRDSAVAAASAEIPPFTGGRGQVQASSSPSEGGRVVPEIPSVQSNSRLNRWTS